MTVFYSSLNISRTRSQLGFITVADIFIIKFRKSVSPIYIQIVVVLEKPIAFVCFDIYLGVAFLHDQHLMVFCDVTFTYIV